MMWSQPKGPFEDEEIRKSSMPQSIHGRTLSSVEEGDLPFVTTWVHLGTSRKLKQARQKIKALYDLKYVNTKTQLSSERE